MSARRRGSIYKRKGRKGWWVRCRIGDREGVRFGGRTKAEAEEKLSELMEELRVPLPADPDTTFSEFSERYLRFVQDERAPLTHSGHTYVLGAWCREIGTMRLREVTAQDIRRVLDGRTHLAASSKNSELMVVRAFFREAMERGLVTENPCATVKRRRTEERAVPALTLAEQDHLFSLLPDQIRNAAIIAVETGLRVRELGALLWTDVNLDAENVTVRRSKTKRPRVVPLLPRSVEILIRLRAERVVSLDRPDRVLPWLRHGLGGERFRTWKRARTAAGFPDLVWHDLRHLYAVNAVRAGVSIPVLGKLMGHANLAQTMRYAGHQAESDFSRAAQLMAARGTTRGTTESKNAGA